MRQSDDLAVMEKKVLETNKKYYFSEMFESYMRTDLLYQRPHGIDLKSDDRDKILAALRKNYPNIDEDIMNLSQLD